MATRCCEPGSGAVQVGALVWGVMSSCYQPDFSQVRNWHQTCFMLGLGLTITPVGFVPVHFVVVTVSLL